MSDWLRQAGWTCFFFSSRRRHPRLTCDWSSDVCSSDLIEVMKLVGATEWFVRGPFVLEGIMTGLIAATIALALLAVAYEPAVAQFKSDVGFIPLSYDPAFISSLARDLLVAGALLGAVGSYIGVRRYVRI